MFEKAAEVLSKCVSQSQLDKGLVYPDISNIRQVSLQIGIEVVKLGVAMKLNREDVPLHNIEEYIKDRMYTPEYHPYVRWDLSGS